jgi:DNA helicase-2/ATP-dependent DNA helicase PcrA
MMATSRLLIESEELGGAARNALRKFIEMVDRWACEAGHMSPRDLTELVLEESGYTDFWRNNKSAKADSKLDNLKEVVNAVSEFDTLAAYLDHVALVADHNEGVADGQVWLMTLHAAKGLEFPVVFLPGWEEGVFPSQRSLDEGGTAALEEERRLAYVGITRARESCRISFAANRLMYGRWQSSLPSRFVDELPESEVEVLSQPGLYGNAASTFASHSRFDAHRVDDDAYYDNPGWKRARAASGRASPSPPMIEGHSKTVSINAPGRSKFQIGARVFHQKFGYGRVVAAEGQKLTVDFDHTGTKKVVDSFLTST